MFQKFSNGILALAAALILTACGGDDAMPVAQESAPLAATPAANAAPAAWNAPAPQQQVAATAVSAPVPANLPAVLNPVQHVSESERRAEELRLVDFEQSYSIEMNRRAQEQSEKERRSAVAVQAGIAQAPGCEGTEGHAALECERSVI
jgi:hypothetical protein